MTSRTVSGVTTTYTDDSDGRTTVQAGGAARTLTWDGRDRMTQAVQGANTIVNTYGPEGALKRRSVNAGAPAQSRDYMQVTDGGGFELNLDGTISSTSIDGPAGGLIAYSGAPAIATTAAFQYFNAHGDSAATANATGVRQDGPNGYDPYGSQDDGTTPAANAAADRWTGRWHTKTDTSLSLIQMGARQYDLATGRFLTVDPVDGGSLNNYDYAGQDPINQYDLDGRQCRRATPAERAAAIRRGQPFLADWVCWSVKPWQKKPVRWLIKKVAIPCGRGAVGAAFAGGTIQWISKVYIGTRAAGPAGAWFSAAACIANVAYQG